MSSSYIIILMISILVLFLVFLSVDFAKNSYQFDILLERMFKNFLRIEKISISFSKDFFSYLCNELRNILLSDLSLFFLIDEKAFHIETISFKNEEVLSALKISQNEKIEIKKLKELKKIREGKLETKFQQNIFKKKKKFLVLPIFQGKKLFAFYIFVYNSRLSLYRAKRKIFFNTRKIKERIIDIITVINERELDIKQVMLESIKDYAFISVDSEYNITSWNKGAEIMFGYDSNEVINKKFIDFIDSGSLQKFYKTVEISEKIDEVKIDLITRDCNFTEVITEGILKRIIIKDIFSGFYIIIKDITKEEIWKNSIKRQAMINKSIVENARDGIVLLNEENRIIYLNEKVKNIINSNGSYLGKEISQVFPRGFGLEMKEKIKELEKSDLELNFVNMKMSGLWYNIRFFPIKSMETLQGVIIFFIDNTYIMNTREKLEEMNKNLIDNLQVAKSMHLSLIPQDLPNNKNIKFESIFLPSDEIGGDFYYIDEIEIEKKKYYLAMLADVSGHGIGASMLTVLVKDVYGDFKSSFEHNKDIDLSLFLKMMNRKIINLNMNGSKFVTLFVILIDIENKVMKYSSAGHPHAITINKEGKSETFGMDKSPPVGIIEEFNYMEEIRNIKSGEKICLFSDGILDIFSNEQELLKQYLLNNNQLSIKGMKEILEEKIINEKHNGDSQEKIYRIDDITVILLEIME